MQEFEQLIGDANSRFGEMIEATPSCVKIIDKTGGLLLMNAKGLSMIAAADFEMVKGESVYPLIEARDKEKFIRFNKAICNGERGQLEFELVDLNGKTHHMETWAAPYQLTNGEFAHIAITNDITEKKRIEETLEKQRGALEVTSRLAYIGELAAGIAHEINNPLSVIAGYAGLLRHQISSGGIDLEILDNHLQSIEETVNRISRITHSLSSLSSDLPAKKNEISSMASIVDETLNLCAERTKAQGICVDVAIDESFMVNVNRAQISQVIMNLLTNAFHAIANLEDKWIKIEAGSRLDLLIIEFSDSGTCIERTVAERMMTPFYTTKNPGQGTGLGLSIAESIIRSYDGRLSYDPISPYTKFIIELPFAELGAL
jgi:two-component system sensor histidine kinase DctS